jgi:DNA primase
VRRHYREDFQARLARLLAPHGAPATVQRFTGRPRPRPVAGGLRSSQFAQRSVAHRSQSVVPPREALILLAAIHHPWLLADHAEELAELDFQHRDAEALRRALLDACAEDATGTPQALAACLERAGAAELVRRMERAITHKADWPVRPEAANADVLAFWHQIVSLHRRKRTLSRELREAERALGTDPTEANFARLKDVQDRLSALDGTEALIEGFGDSSGRPARTM